MGAGENGDAGIGQTGFLFSILFSSASSFLRDRVLFQMIGIVLQGAKRLQMNLVRVTLGMAWCME